MSEKIIEFKSVNKWYGKFHVLKDINLFVNKGEKIILLTNHKNCAIILYN